MLDLSKKKILVTGGSGFLGCHVVDELHNRGCNHVYTPRSVDYDLRTSKGIQLLLGNYDVDIAVHLAATAGGIGLNAAKPAELFYNNIMMGVQLMHEAWADGVEKFVQVGTICEYPCLTPTPFKEENLWMGFPEPTNSAYGIAKRALLTQGQAYRQQYGFNVIHLLPVNLYGVGDHFDPETSHVIPALIRKFAEAKKNHESKVTIWGDGSASREFLYVEDCAKAIIQATELYDKPEPVNVGTGSEISIRDTANLIANLLDFKGDIVYDDSKPNGQPRRCLDVTRAEREFGFKAQTDLVEGLKKTIDWYLNG